MHDPHQLRVTYQGRPIGHVSVTERMPGKIRGRLIPAETFEQNRELFDEAIAWAKQFDESHDSSSLDYRAFDQWVEVVKRLTPMIAFPELSVHIDEFAVDHELGVEVSFANAVV